MIPGRNVDLGDRFVHIVSSPGGPPTVLLVGGCGVPYYQWDAVVAGLDGRAVVRLDRPGLTGTPWPGVLPTLAAEVATLDDLLHTVEGPVIAVAHSMAGPHLEAFARLHPGRLAGLVLVDGSVDLDPRPQRSQAAWLALSRAVHAVGILPPLRRLGSLADRVIVAGQSSRRIRDRAHPQAKAVYRNRDAMASVVAEQAAYRQQLWDLEQIRTARPWPPLPTIVLTAARAGGARWVEVQRVLAQLLAAELVVLDSAKHMIMLDEPEAIVDAVRAVTGIVTVKP